MNPKIKEALLTVRRNWTTDENDPDAIVIDEALALCDEQPTVPMAMLDALVEYGLNSDGIAECSRKIRMHEIAESFGYKAV